MNNHCFQNTIPNIVYRVIFWLGVFINYTIWEYVNFGIITKRSMSILIMLEKNLNALCYQKKNVIPINALEIYN